MVVVSNEPGAAGFGVGSTLWTGSTQPWQMGITTDSSPEQALFAYIYTCLLYTSDAADERSSVDLGGRRIIKKKKTRKQRGT